MKLDCSFLEKLDPSLYSFVAQNPLIDPKLISINKHLSKEIGFQSTPSSHDSLLQILNGHKLFEGSTPFSYAYSGHQFGYFVPNLGDGRALNLGKLHPYHLQLKGSGITPYSRDGDGRAVLRSSIREYLVSEAMYGLGVPTSRALVLIGSQTKVIRHYEPESAALVLRAATSWIRFGSFEFAYIQKEKKEYLLKKLADFVIQESYPHLLNSHHKYEELYFAIVDKTIELMALWQSIGFMHGVMNTDNMSIAGLTIDYGPYAFMEQFEKGFVCNLSDHEGRYSFENQPFIAQWNLSVLAKILSPIADQKILDSYNDMFIGKFKQRYFELMAQKIGLENYHYQKDGQLIVRMLKAMEADKIDYTSFFYSLSGDSYDFIGENINHWIKEYHQRLQEESISKETRLEAMKRINPKYILRNSMLQDAIDGAQNGDYTLVNDFLEIAHNPYGEFPKYEHYTQPKPDFEPLKCSCSS